MAQYRRERFHWDLRRPLELKVVAHLGRQQTHDVYATPRLRETAVHHCLIKNCSTKSNSATNLRRVSDATFSSWGTGLETGQPPSSHPPARADGRWAGPPRGNWDLDC
eukprot:991162-Pyramimonas_sp.AAC.1